MLVKHLIKELQKYDPNKEVVVTCYMADFEIHNTLYFKDDEFVEMRLKEYHGYYTNDGN